MPHRVLVNILPVWVVYILSWVLQLTVYEWMNILAIAKDFIALIGFALAASYTLYKFRKEWSGWNPKKKKRKIKPAEEEE